ncbi:MAG: hypothetical protein ACYSR9_14250, partial [Planctomycetota bacterium]
MSTRRKLFGFLVCFSMAVFVGQTLSQTRGRSRRNRSRNTNQQPRQQALERQKLQLKKQMGPGKSEKELMKPILRATEKQWKAIEAKVNKVRELRSLANVSIELMRGGSMSGSSVVVNKGSGRGSMSGSEFGSMSGSMGSMSVVYRWFRPSQTKGFENLNEGEKICEELFRLLEDKNSELEEIR